MSDLRMVVLGCGPAGLIAAHAGATLGCDVRILSKPRKSFMKGAQYLHEPIPGVPASRFTIDYSLVGSVQGYAEKVYADQRDIPHVSPETLVGEHDAWDIRESYNWLWDTYGRYVSPWEAGGPELTRILSNWGSDLVVSSVPRPLFCAAGHTFNAQRIWSTDQDLGYLSASDDNKVVCNGDDAPSWYRLARVHGWNTVEWSGQKAPPIVPMWEVMKPIIHNCSCVPRMLGEVFKPPMYLEVGRYGRWQKGILSHEAYKEVVSCIRSLQS